MVPVTIEQWIVVKFHVKFDAEIYWKKGMECMIVACTFFWVISVSKMIEKALKVIHTRVAFSLQTRIQISKKSVIWFDLSPAAIAEPLEMYSNLLESESWFLSNNNKIWVIWSCKQKSGTCSEKTDKRQHCFEEWTISMKRCKERRILNELKR